jgi:hypothetical protein
MVAQLPLWLVLELLDELLELDIELELLELPVSGRAVMPIGSVETIKSS